MAWVNIANKESALSVRNKLNALGANVDTKAAASALTSLQTQVNNLNGTGVDLVAADATKLALAAGATIEDGLMELLKRISTSNLTLFKIKTTDATSGTAIVGYTLQITSPYAPTTTTYTTNSNGYIYVLLPFGSYTMTITDTMIGYNPVSAKAFSSVSGESYKEIAPIFVRTTTKTYTMDTTKTYKKAPYISTIDLWMCGGGGSGGGAGAASTWVGSGGGGAYTRTVLGVNVSAHSEFIPIIGAGGSGWDTGGGQTAFLGYTANGGSGGINNNNGDMPGGAGGSGGGGSSKTLGGNGGSDGSNGGNATIALGGAGQGTTTKAFGEAGGTLYCGGGGGAKSGSAGAGGGGAGASNSGNRGGSGTLYGGGGGGAYGSSSNSFNGGDGAAGAVLIRWA